MRFCLRFNDLSDNALSGEDFNAMGESPGWTGQPETSRWIDRRESLEVPIGASRLQVWMNTAGPHETMGVYALDSLFVTLIDADPETPNERIEMIPNTGSLQNTAFGVPKGWARLGTKLNMARIAPRDGRPPLILMHDDHTTHFGGWLTLPAKSVPIEGIQKVVVEWKEAYSIGWGGAKRISYAKLPVGSYKLLLQPLTVNGLPAGEVTEMSIAVVVPFYQNPWFLRGLALAAALLMTIIVRHMTRRRIQRRLDALEQERAVEHERSRIARDLHDNLSADLTHLALLSDLAQSDVKDPAKSGQHLDQIFNLANHLTRLVDEIVWAVNPSKDSLQGFVPYIINYCQNYLLAAQIPCRLDIPASLPEFPLSSMQRHHLLLVIKEALHNIVKHANATEVWIRISANKRFLDICVEDNGCGVAANHAEGDGTGNMHQRMELVNGSFERNSQPSGGTLIKLTIHPT